MRRAPAVPTRTRAFLREHTQPGQTLLLACSGGGDSVALLVLADEARAPLGLEVVVASVDHGLRAESAAEVQGVGALCVERGLDFVPLRAELEPGPDLQRRAREERYRRLHALALERGATLVTAHTRDDQAETVLSRVLRGGRVDALRGIAPARPLVGDDGARVPLLRPLLGVGREELRAFLRHRGVAWVEDPSNEDVRFERVRMRAWLAELAREDPRVHEHLAALAEDARRATGLRRARGRRLRARSEDGDALWLARLRRWSVAARREVLRQWLRARTGHNPSDAVLDAAERMVVSGEGEVRLRGGLLRRHGDRLVVE